MPTNSKKQSLQSKLRAGTAQAVSCDVTDRVAAIAAIEAATWRTRADRYLGQ